MRLWKKPAAVFTALLLHAAIEEAPRPQSGQGFGRGGGVADVLQAPDEVVQAYEVVQIDVG